MGVLMQLFLFLWLLGGSSRLLRNLGKHCFILCWGCRPKPCLGGIIPPRPPSIFNIFCYATDIEQWGYKGSDSPARGVGDSIP